MWTQDEIAKLIQRARLLLNWEIELVVREVEKFPTEENIEQLCLLTCNHMTYKARTDICASLSV